jgi:hypothetical protein
MKGVPYSQTGGDKNPRQHTDECEAEIKQRTFKFYAVGDMKPVCSRKCPRFTRSREDLIENRTSDSVLNTLGQSSGRLDMTDENRVAVIESTEHKGIDESFL